MMFRTYSKGTIEVITGPMFSGKSEELIKRIRILGYAKINTLVVKPSLDTRWDKDSVISRTGATLKTFSVKDTKELKQRFDEGNFDAVAIDEVQFFDSKLIDYLIHLANNGVRVIASGLDMDWKGMPFGILPNLLAVSDSVSKQQAVCNQCGKAASMTFKLKGNNAQVEVGDTEYEPRCRMCHHRGMLEKHSNETFELSLKGVKK